MSAGALRTSGAVPSRARGGAGMVILTMEAQVVPSRACAGVALSEGLILRIRPAPRARARASRRKVPGAGKLPRLRVPSRTGAGETSATAQRAAGTTNGTNPPGRNTFPVTRMNRDREYTSTPSRHEPGPSRSNPNT